MPPPVSNLGRDELDDLFNYDANLDGALGATDQARSDNKRSQQGGTGDDNIDVGIDKEVEVVRKRKQAPKLDAELLLSANGIPKLRRISKERLRFKGKGHEYSDISRLLNMYQLWLDELYPRAKFLDGITMIEKAGHTKRMQVMRKEWINESKPKAPGEEDMERLEDLVSTEVAAENPEAKAEKQQEPPEAQTRENEQVPDKSLSPAAGGPDDDELDALLAEDAQREASEQTSTKLDSRPKPAASNSLFGGGDEFEDEMEVLEGMDIP
ncbi:replication fork protection component Swi3-domain-containing protein [Lineolata rhizophorae]|uniref:Chromosome segregation in meiosis protein n=1 Tax=Lineolata rhizophorae TaxID=578093 RepID=A0A6A6P3A7_9PEZI|nr:replication fork protection component Swi3-domain-containing protein [Lineolata rhizophorae]